MDWNNPTTSTAYATFLSDLKTRDAELAAQFHSGTITLTNPPANAKRWNSTSNLWEMWNGTAWVALAATYAINVASVGGFTPGNASGNVPVSNGTVNTNLNADMVDGRHAGTGANNVLLLDASGKVPVGNLPTSGVTAGTYRSVTVDSTGRVTGGTNPTTIAGYGITDAASTASPAFTGTPTAPTAAADTNTTQLATTAFVLAQATGATPLMDGTAAVGTSTRFARADHRHPTDTSRAPLASPTFTGTPAGPTPTFSSNGTQLATSAFVRQWAGNYRDLTVLTTNTVLALTDMGKTVVCNASMTLTVPAANTVPAGASVTVICGSNIPTTILPTGADTFAANRLGSSSVSYTLPTGNAVTLISNGVNAWWIAGLNNGPVVAFCAISVSGGVPSVISGSSFNVGSIDDNGVGDFTLNFPIALPSAAYVVAGAGTTSSAVQQAVTMSLVSSSAGGAPTLKTASQCRIKAAYGGAAVDPVYLSFIALLP